MKSVRMLGMLCFCLALTALADRGGKIPWGSDYPKALKDAAGGSKPLLVYFTCQPG